MVQPRLSAEKSIGEQTKEKRIERKLAYNNKSVQCILLGGPLSMIMGGPKTKLNIDIDALEEDVRRAPGVS